jgi:hypothetical protein
MQQIQNRGLQRRGAVQSLLQQQPHHHQGIIDRIIESGFGIPAGLFDKTGRNDFLEQGKNPGNRRLSGFGRS